MKDVKEHTSPEEMIAAAEFRANSLAEVIKREGKGMLWGKFSMILRLQEGAGIQNMVNGYTCISGFEHGILARDQQDASRFNLKLEKDVNKAPSLPNSERYRFHQPYSEQPEDSSSFMQPRNRQIVITQPHLTDTQVKEVKLAMQEKTGFFGRRESVINSTTTTRTDHVPSGNTVIQVSSALDFPWDRRDCDLTARLVIPSGLASEVISEMHQNPYIPNALYNAIWPGFIDENDPNRIKRYPADSVLFVDLLTDPRKASEALVTLPKTIPF